MNPLLQPVSIGKLDLPNRLVMAPMTRSRATDDGLVTALHAEYYAQRASAGLIISESTQPSVIGQGYIQTPGIHAPAQVEAWRLVTRAVHDAGGRIFNQLTHTGRIGHPSLYPDDARPVAPSAVASGEQLFNGAAMLDHPVPRAMTHADIATTIDDFAHAARNAIEAGFDGVELHGANGYLLHQFLADNTNVRDDDYGGSTTNRIRFVVEVVEAVAAAIGPERTAIKVSPANPFNGIAERDSTELYRTLMQALGSLPLAYVHVGEVGDRSLTQTIRDAWQARWCSTRIQHLTRSPPRPKPPGRRCATVSPTPLAWQRCGWRTPTWSHESEPAAPSTRPIPPRSTAATTAATPTTRLSEADAAATVEGAE